MKRLLSISLFIFSVSYAIAGPMDINGTIHNVDTLTYKQVGPGVTYCCAQLPEMKQKFHVLTIDLNNEYANVETYLAKDCVEGTELVTAACNRKTKDGKDAYCGINADFFNVSAHNEYPLGAPRGGSIEDGVIQVQPRDLGWGYATIDENKKPLLNNMQFCGEVILDNHKSYSFQKVNIPYESSNMTFYNRFAGEKTRPYENNGGYDTVRRTEVVIVPVEGESWGINRSIRVKVKRVVHNINGGEPIAFDESVLSGVKDAAIFLDKIKVGDEFTINMNITSIDGEKPNIKQLVGGNAMILKKGELTNRNTNDGYNSTPYPRTAIGTSEDGRWIYMFVCDGKGVGGAPGLSTYFVAGILKNAGAYDVVGCDGGGSSEMVVNHEIVNRPADGNERAVGNGWLVVSTAPDDNEIASVRFLNHKLEVPMLASYTPVVLGYNKYGKLIDNDVKGFTLSCDSIIGTCKDSTFTAGGKACSGKISIHLGNITQTENISVIKSNIAIRLDSVIVDQDVDYPVEVLSYAENEIMQISPDRFNWEIGDAHIAKIDDKGILNGVSNGRTILKCNLNDFNDSIIVISEINEPKIEAEAFTNTSERWSITSTSKSWNAAFNDSVVKFNFKGGRNPFVQINGPMRVFSLPDSIGFSFKSSIELKNILAGFNYPQNKKIKVITIDGLKQKEENEIIFNISDILENPNDLSYYPVLLEYIRFSIDGSNAVKGDHTILLKGINLYYNYENVTAIIPLESQCELMIYPNPAQDNFIVDVDGKDRIEIFDMSGRCILTKEINNRDIINISTLTNGTYIVKSNKFTSKLIVK